MWTVTVCFMTICLLAHVKASPDISLEALLERLITLEDWKRETEQEVTALREKVAQQVVLIYNLERDLAIQANLTASLQSAKKDVTLESPDTLEHHKETDDAGDDGQKSDNKIRDLDTPVPVQQSSLSTRQIAGGIAFTAYLDHDIDPGSQQTIKFNRIITNDGNAYNIHTGVFTCPEAGMYLFSFHVAERSQTEGMRQLYTELRVNSQPKVGAVAETVHAAEDDQGGNTAVIRLQQGDAVWVDATAVSSSHIVGNDHRFSTFTGVYLYG